MYNWMMDKTIGFVAHKLDGKKTLIGGVGMILFGAVGMIGHYWPDLGLPAMEFDKGANMIISGFVVLGLGGKLQKVVDK
jgi:hypothetical protein